MYPDRARALEILRDAEHSSPGLWALHSLEAARCAEHIARRVHLDPDKAYVLGLLHDIGRKFGAIGFRHVVDGYRYMLSLGYDEVARICLTHSFNTWNLDDYVGAFDVPEEDTAVMRALLSSLDPDEYDRLIQLCDCLAGTGKPVDMEWRMDDVQRRHGPYPEAKREKNRLLRRHFEEIAHESIYRIVSDDPALWGL